MRYEASPMEIVSRYTGRAPVNLDAIARDLEIPVERLDLGTNVAGSIFRDKTKSPKSGFVIRINSTQHPNRQRFTLAHELAHYLLHRDLIDSGITDDVMYRSEAGGHHETQANRVAADIIMPFDLVKEMYERGHDTNALARMFGVSSGAMDIRLERIRPLAGQASLF